MEMTDSFSGEYKKLRRIARSMVRGSSLESTDLVNMAWLRTHKGKLGVEVSGSPEKWIGLLIVAMRHSLVDYARRRKNLKDPRSKVRCPIDVLDSPAHAMQDETTVIEVNDALEKLYAMRVANPERMRSVVELRLQNFSWDEIRQVLGLSKGELGKTIEFARRKLAVELGRTGA